MKIISIILLVSIVSSCNTNDKVINNKKNISLPSFDIILADSTTHFNTSSIPFGKPITIFYFAPWCPYSKMQIEQIIKEIDLLADVQFYVVTTSTFSEMKEFYNHYNLKKYQNIKVGIDYTNFYDRYFKAEGVPFMAFYDTQKRLKGTCLGIKNPRQILEITTN